MNTVSIEIGIELEKKGIVKESYFSWVDNGVTRDVIPTHEICTEAIKAGMIICPAPTVGELLVLLPEDVFLYRDKDGWNIEAPKYQDLDDEDIIDQNPADAIGKMLLWLEQEGGVFLDCKLDTEEGRLG